MCLCVCVCVCVCMCVCVCACLCVSVFMCLCKKRLLEEKGKKKRAERFVNLSNIQKNPSYLCRAETNEIASVFLRCHFHKMIFWKDLSLYLSIYLYIYIYIYIFDFKMLSNTFFKFKISH